ncbi:hypothetical protein ACRW34_26170, partial [Escherichia coli]
MPQVAARMASRDENTGRYQRHRPEQTLLYRIVEEYYPTFAAHLAAQGRELPGYVQREFDGTVAKLAMRQPFVLFKGLTFQKLCLPGAFRPGD